MKPAITQMGYVTANMEAALDFWINVVGAGPFFYAEYEPESQVYRGKPTAIRFRVAYGYSGDMNIEVIQQLSGGPSAYTEALESGRLVPSGGLFHHVMLSHAGYDASYDGYVAAGAERCFDAFVPGVGRFCYLDAHRLMDCYLELVEDTTVFDAARAKMREIHRNWDGSNPRRDLESVLALL